MDLRAYINIETTKNERRYTLSVPWGAPYAECYEASVEFGKKLLELAQQEADRADAASKESSETIDPEVVEVLPNC